MRRKKYNRVVWTDEKKEMAIEKITDFIERYGVGECIMQNDDAIIESPGILADIADEILIEGEGIFYNED